MKIFKLKYSQKLPINLNEAWDFLSSPNNLELITPKSMDFNITDCNIPSDPFHQQLGSGRGKKYKPRSRMAISI